MFVKANKTPRVFLIKIFAYDILLFSHVCQHTECFISLLVKKAKKLARTFTLQFIHVIVDI